MTTAVLFLALAVQSPPAAQQSACARVLTDAAAGELCAGEEADRLGAAAAKGSAEQKRQFSAAAEHFRKAATLSTNVETTVLALSRLAQESDSQHLNDPKQGEGA